MKEPIISVSGLRGIIGETLTPRVAVDYAAAFAADLPAGPVVLTRDGRLSGTVLGEAIRSALCASGRDVIDGGVAATPTTGILVRQFQAAGGIQISASHNPPQYNGMKLFSRSGRVIPADEGEVVLQRYRSGGAAWADHKNLGQVTLCGDTISEHCSLVLETVDVERIRSKRFHVVLDSNGGAGSILGRELLERLGCELMIFGGTPDGNFLHEAEPTAENLGHVGSEITRLGADVGFCQDPDADRLAVIDAGGKYIGEEYTLALCLDHLLKTEKGPVVTNCSTSRMSEDLAEKYGVPFYRSPVGEANVTGEMLRRDALFGGEGNGGPIDPRVGLVRDSFVGMARILDAMAARGMTVAQLVAQLPSYAICKTKVSLDRERIPDALDALEKHFKDCTPDRMDGLRLDRPGQWLLVRASNTEPIVRVIAEAPAPEEAAAFCEEASGVIEGM